MQSPKNISAQAHATPEDELPFRHYSLKHRVIAWTSTRLFGRVTYTVRHGLLKGMKRRGGLGWIPEQFAGGSDTAESRFWENFDCSGMVVYDVGAFEGLLSMFFASKARQVICFEPNSKNSQRLIENLALNRLTNTSVYKLGVGSVCEKRNMVGDPLMPGGSSVDGAMMGGIQRAGSAVVTQEISIVTLDEQLREANLPPPDFIKIDIEGFELEALRGARNILESHYPRLFLEMHGESMRDKRRKVSEIVEYLWGLDYRNILHIETGVQITPENSSLAAEGHLYAIRS